MWRRWDSDVFLRDSPPDCGTVGKESSVMARRAKGVFCLLAVIAVLLEPLCFSAKSRELSTPPDPGVILEIERSICCVILDLIAAACSMADQG